MQRCSRVVQPLDENRRAVVEFVLDGLIDEIQVALSLNFGNGLANGQPDDVAVARRPGEDLPQAVKLLGAVELVF